MLLGTQFQHFISEVVAESSPATAYVHVSSPPYNVHLEEMDLSYPGDIAGPRSHLSHQNTSLFPYQNDTRTPLIIVGGVGDQISWIG